MPLISVTEAAELASSRLQFRTIACCACRSSLASSSRPSSSSVSEPA